MLYDVIRAKYVGGYKIELEFEDGKIGIVDFSRYLEKEGVFKSFEDNVFFRNFSVNEDLGTLTWSNGVDVAPEVLYAEATGSPFSDWSSIYIKTRMS